MPLHRAMMIGTACWIMPSALLWMWKSKYMQIAYPVTQLKKLAYGKGRELAENYDKVMQAQYDFSGATKYNRIPKKRILARVNFNYFMFRDGDGVAFEGYGRHYEIGDRSGSGNKLGYSPRDRSRDADASLAYLGWHDGSEQ